MEDKFSDETTPDQISDRNLTLKAARRWDGLVGSDCQNCRRKRSGSSDGFHFAPFLLLVLLAFVDVFHPLRSLENNGPKSTQEFQRERKGVLILRLVLLQTLRIVSYIGFCFLSEVSFIIVLALIAIHLYCS